MAMKYAIGKVAPQDIPIAKSILIDCYCSCSMTVMQLFVEKTHRQVGGKKVILQWLIEDGLNPQLKNLSLPK
jgi:hypothetical protein